MNFTFKILNYYANQKVPGLFLQIDKQQFLINTPELIQRYLSCNSVSISENTDIIVTNTDLQYHAGIQGLMCQIITKNFNKISNLIMPYDVYNYINEYDYVFAKSFANFSMCGIKDHKLFQSKYGITMQSKECQEMSLKNFCDWQNYIENLRQQKCENLFNVEKQFGNNSIFIDQEIINKHQLLVFTTSSCQVIFIPMDSKRTVFSLLIIPFPKKNLDKEKLKKFNLVGSKIGLLQKDKQVLFNDQIYPIDFFYKAPKKQDSLFILDIQSNIDQEQIQKVKNIFDDVLTCENFNTNNVIHIYNDKVFQNKLYENISQYFNNEKFNNIFVNQIFDQDYDHYNKPNYFLHYTSNHLPYIFPEIQQQQKHKSEIIKSHYKDFTTINSSSTYNLKQNCLQKLKYQSKNFYLYEKSLDQIFDFKNNDQLQNYSKILSQKNNFNNFPFLVFLGTGSQNPNAYRNVSSILLGVNDNCYMLLDCGEGTYIQLLNQFGNKIQEVLRKIKFVYLSHIHGDHTFGTFQLIAQRQKVLSQQGIEDPLIVCSPNNVRKIFKSFEDNIGYKNSYYFISLEKLMEIQNIKIQDFQKYFTSIMDVDYEYNYWNYRHKNQQQDLDYYNSQYWNEEIQNYFLKFMIENKIKKILPLPVKHCAQSSGVRLDLQTKSIVYSGDCKKSLPLSEYGKNCDLMIHECTLDCQFTEQQVKDKGHSDPSIAFEIARDAKANYLALTHFSQRYQYSSEEFDCNIQLFRKDNSFKDFFKTNTFMARDHLYVDFDILPTICKIHNNFNKFVFTDLN